MVKDFRLGLIVRADKTGLGYQSRSYYKHLNPDKVLLVDISKYNQQPQYYGWYQNYQLSKGFPDERLMRGFLKDLDIVLTAETPYNYSFYAIAKEMGVKFVVAPNYEFFDHFDKPQLPIPDALFVPSMWHYKELAQWAKEHNVFCKYMHHPVDLEEVPFKQRTTTFHYHVAGKIAANDRNGTEIYLQAFPNGRITTQTDDTARRIQRRYHQVRIKQNLTHNYELYDTGDILIYPRRYGGNSLVLNEALAAGCPVIMPNTSPNDVLLPQEWLVKTHTQNRFTPRTVVDLYTVNPQDLIYTYEQVAGNIEAYSRQAYEIAQTISWQQRKQEWVDTLVDVLQS